jgi:xanthine dehydrogenase small subunit
VLDTLIHLGDVTELQELRDTGNDIEIGAGVKYSDALDTLEQLYPDVGSVIRRIGSVQIRNSGTIGGNIANGSPIGDMPPLLIAAGTELVLQAGPKTRLMPIEDFFIDYGKQDLKPGEFVKSVRVPKPGKSQKFFAYKISKRFEQDISALCVGISFNLESGKCQNVRIAYGGMAATPKRGAQCEAALEGAPWNEESIAKAMTALETDFTPISDMRASSDYRMKAAQNLLMKAYLESQSPDKLRVLEAGYGR